MQIVEPAGRSNSWKPAISCSIKVIACEWEIEDDGDKGSMRT